MIGRSSSSASLLMRRGAMLMSMDPFTSSCLRVLPAHHAHGMNFATCKKVKHVPIHGAQKPAFAWDIDFSGMELKYPVDSTKTFLLPRRGWAPPPEDERRDLPFYVLRTEMNGIPVYSDFKAGRTKVVTMIRKLHGDVNELASEFSKIADGKVVRIKPGHLEVDGNYVMRTKKWLIGLGF